MRIQLFSHVLIILLWLSLSEGIFFNYPKNALMNFFNSLREKKEALKKPPPIPDIHHYHLHYYPVHVQSYHTSLKSLKAPDKHELLDSINTNKLENYGWSDEYRYMHDPFMHHIQNFLDPWVGGTESHGYHKSEIEAAETSENGVDRHSEEAVVGKSAGAGILVQVPLHQQIILQQPVKAEKPKEKHFLVAFLEKLKNIKNSLFPSEDHIQEKSDTDAPIDDVNSYVVYSHPAGRRLK